MGFSSATALPASLGAGPKRGFLDFEFLAPFHQRRFTRRVSRELLILFRSKRPPGPGTRDRRRYGTLVQDRLLVDAQEAESLLRRAEESFASWPVERDLTLRDVVHMIAIREFGERFGTRRWIQAEMGRVVASQIPQDL